MSAGKKRMVSELKAGKYPSWIFGDADHLPIEGVASVDRMGEYIIHTEYPRFLTTIEANDTVYELTEPIAAGTPLTKAIYGMGFEAFVVVAWETDGDVAEVKYSHFVNLDDTAFDLNAVLECLGEATQYWSIRMADENSVEL
jgi:hypothetical protein